MGIPYGRQEVTETDIAKVVETLQSDFLTTGPVVKDFEEAFAKYVDATYAVAVSSGTAALHLCALALDVKPGQKVLVSALTFAASVNCIRYCGAEVEFVDIDPDTLLMDLSLLEEKLISQNGDQYVGIVAVDFAGYPLEMQKVKAIADRYKLWIIEDACHAPGGSWTDSEKPQISPTKYKCGSGQFADLAIFSFHPTKHIATGEGGMITSRNERLYQRLLRLRNHGMTKEPDLLRKNDGPWYYEIHELGYNYRLSAIHAALGLSQLNRAEENLEKRHSIANRYVDAFGALPIKMVQASAHIHHAYHLFVIQVAQRKELYDYLRANDIYTQVHYIPVPMLPYYQDLGYDMKDFPHTMDYYQQCLSIPMYPSLKEEEIAFVIKKIKAFYG